MQVTDSTEFFIKRKKDQTNVWIRIDISRRLCYNKNMSNSIGVYCVCLLSTWENI